MATKAEQRAATTARLIEVAREQFTTHGYADAPTEDIVRIAGVTRGALYHHIKSKDQLLFEVLLTPHLEVVDEADAILSSPKSPEEKLQTMTRTYMRNLVQKRLAWTITSRDLGALAEFRRAEIITLQRRHQAQWRELFDQCEQAGLIGKVSDLHFRGFLGMLSQAFNWIGPQGAKSPQKVADAYLDLLLNGLRPR